MMRRILMTTLVTIAVVSIDIESQGPTLRSRAAAGEDVTLEVRAEYPRPEFETIVMESDPIVIGVVEYGVAILTEQDSMLSTDYHFRVQTVVRQSKVPGLATGAHIIVRRMGGATTIDGHNVTVIEPDFPPFAAGETYVLFLTSMPNQAFYDLSYGAQSAFLVGAGRNVKQASRSRGDWNLKRGTVSLADFLQEVTQIASSR